MTRRHYVQWDFTGGEISTKMLMRADTEVYNKSVLEMENFQPTKQGGAIRSPGTRFVYDPTVVQAENMRILPYLTPTNEYALAEFKVGALRVLTGYPDFLSGFNTPTGPGVGGQVPIRTQIVPNFDMIGGPDPWQLEPTEYTGGEGDTLGLKWLAALGGVIQGVARVWRPKDIDTCTITNTAEVTSPTNNITIDFSLLYVDNFTNPEASYDCKVKIGTAAGGQNVYLFNFTGPPGTLKDIVTNVPLPAPGWTGTLYLTVEWKALSTPENKNSTPFFRLFRFGIWADDVVTIEETDVLSTPPPYTNAELPDLHFIQSPYSAPAASPTDPAKQLVVCHPNHPPHQLWFNTDAAYNHPDWGVLPVGYVFTRIIFDNPPNWSANNYPNTCTSFNGRLILAGAQDGPLPGQAISPATETVWGTEVGNWQKFTAPGAPTITAADSIEFTTIYRSPIQWVYGQKNLLVGAREMEYVGYADGIFQPADIGVEMQSTHGSNHVQPAGFGESVLFSAEGGRRVRELQFQNEDDGWVAPDMTFYHPDITKTGIVRMVRMRNPHQMLVCLLNNGQIALLHLDRQARMAGWSRLVYDGNIKDICVLVNSAGEDVLFLTIKRWIQGVPTTYVEAIPNWSNVRRSWDYVSSTTFQVPETVTNVITGLDHLEGKQVQVVATRDFLGTYTVTGGQITLVDQIGQPIDVPAVAVGLTIPCRMRLLPPRSADPGSQKRYSEISVRLRDSTRPIINGVRPHDRTPARIMGKSEDLEAFEDVQVTNLGTDIYQIVTIEENLPLRCEVLGVYGKLKESSL